MCGRRRQPVLVTAYGAPSHANNNVGGLFAPPASGHHMHTSCHQHQRSQTLTGLAITAIATAIEKKTAERNARNTRNVPYAANSRHHGQVSGVTPADGARGAEAYEAGRLDDLVRDLSLNDNATVDEKAAAEKGVARTHPPPPPVLRDGDGEDVPPPAYTPTVTPEGPVPRSVVQDEVTATDTATARALPALTTPLLARHATHPIIVTDLHHLNTAIEAYRNSNRCGGACAVKRARKQLVRDLGMLEAEWLRREGVGRREVRVAMREGRREGKGIREEVRLAMRV